MGKLIVDNTKAVRLDDEDWQEVLRALDDRYERALHYANEGVMGQDWINQIARIKRGVQQSVAD